MKTVLKALAVVICAGLLIWNAAQLKAIEEGTYEVADDVVTKVQSHQSGFYC